MGFRVACSGFAQVGSLMVTDIFQACLSWGRSIKFKQKTSEDETWRKHSESWVLVIARSGDEASCWRVQRDPWFAGRRTADLIKSRRQTEGASSCATSTRRIGRLFSRYLPGTLDATTPADVDLSRYDMVGLAMQSRNTPTTLSGFCVKIAEAKLPFLFHHEYAASALSQAQFRPFVDGPRIGLYNAPGVGRFSRDCVALLRPIAAFPPRKRRTSCRVGLRPLQGGRRFATRRITLLRSSKLDSTRVNLTAGHVPVKLTVFDSLGRGRWPKWSMFDGNLAASRWRSRNRIPDAVHSRPEALAVVYDHVDTIARRLGADPGDQVPFRVIRPRRGQPAQAPSAAPRGGHGAPFIELVETVFLVKRILPAATRQCPLPDRRRVRSGSEIERADSYRS